MRKALLFISRDDRFELMPVYAPDGKEFCFSVSNEHWSHFEIWHTLFDGHKRSDIYWVRIDKIIERLKKDAGIH